MRKGIIYLSVFLLLLAAPTGIRYLRYYNVGSPERAEPPRYDPINVSQVPTPAAVNYVDEPEIGHGLVLLDQGHNNGFTLDEISYLDGRLAARGFELLPYTEGDLALALRPVNTFIVIAPLTNFNSEEIQAVSDFVDRGGRLLLVGDPTRFNVIFDEEDPLSFSFHLDTDKLPLNSLANAFDIIFNGDYLYNTMENEGNFRNIVIKAEGLDEGALTEGVEQLAFYGSHSLQVGPDGVALLTADENTWSSATDRPGKVALAATSHEGRVLALGDVHFLTEPYYTVFDNSRFIAHVADFLTESSSRRFVLADFPYFYQRAVNLVYIGVPDLGPDAFDEIIALQDAFRRVDHSLELAAEPQPEFDTLYLGLYNQSEAVNEILASAGITLVIDPPVAPAEETPAGEEGAGSEVGGNADQEPAGAGSTAEPEEETIRLIQSELGSVRMSGTALILLTEDGDQRNLVVLAASKEGLENTVNRLLNLVPLNADYALVDCLLQGHLALCPTSVAAEEVEAELITSGTPVIEEVDGGGEGDGEEGGGGDSGEIDAVNKGSIGLGETVEETLAENEKHAWTFRGGPTTIDIVLSSGEDLDGVLELYGPDNQLINSSDSTYTGEDEQLLAMEIPDDKDYTIVARDYFNDGGSYTLTVTEAEGTGESSGNSIFIFADDDGTALTTGFTSAETLAAFLSPDYQVTTWVSTLDGPLQEDSLSGYDLVIWDSGDYRDEEGFVGEDTAVVVNYLDAGGDIFITGASPTIFGPIELAPLSDLEVAGDDPILLDGLTAGDVIPLDQTYDAALSDLLGSTPEEDAVGFFLRGPSSEGSGNVAGIAIRDATLNNQKTVMLMLPFVALPVDIQEIVIGNVMAWFGFSSS